MTTLTHSAGDALTPWDDEAAVDYLLLAPAAGTEHVGWVRATRALDVASSTSQIRPPQSGQQLR